MGDQISRAQRLDSCGIAGSTGSFFMFLLFIYFFDGTVFELRASALQSGSSTA
jgi:hypothetical protein